MLARIAVLVSGGGTNLQALLDAQRVGKLPHGEIVLVLSSKEGAYALERAQKAGVETKVLPRKEFVCQEDFDRELVGVLQEKQIDLVILAGFMTILGAAVSADGQVALATESSQSYRSEVLVFDRKGKELFHWFSVDLTVLDVTFRPRQKQIAVLGLSASGGEMRSTVHLFSWGGKETGATHTYSATGPMMTSLQFFDNGRLGVIGDTAVWVYDPTKNETTAVAFEESLLLGYAFSPDGISIVTRDYGEGGGGVLQQFSATGEEVGTFSFESDYRHVAAADGGFYLLTEGMLYLVNKGAAAKQKEVLTDSLMVTEMHGKPLVLGLSTLTRIAWE